MKRIRRFLAVFLLVAIMATTVNVTAFPAFAKSKTVKTKSIKLNKKGTITMTVGDKLTLKATVKPKKSTQKVKWSTSDKAIATVSKGVVKAKKAGKATIKATSGKKSAKVTIEVVEKAAVEEEKPKATEAPAKATKAPAKATEAPAVEATKAPQATEAPAKATEAPAKATEAPAKPTEAPAKATEAPAKATEAPAKATEAPPKATEVPAKATEAPAKATEAPAKETEAPTKATEAPTEKPEATEAPADEATKQPEEAGEVSVGDVTQEEPTEKPMEEATVEPAEQPTEAATEQPVGESTEAPTEEPTEEPTAEPTVTPAPALKLGGLKADKTTVAPGKELGFSFSVENAESVTWSAKRSDGLAGGSGDCAEGAFSWKPAESGVYTVTVTAKGLDGTTATRSRNVTVRAGKLKVTAKATTGYAMVGGEDLSYDVKIKGGCEPYEVSIVVEYKDKKIFSSDEFVSPVKCEAKGYGKNKLTVTVTDATGDTVKAKAEILSATNEKNDAPGLPGLRKDMTFAEKLVAVAKSQLGYRESEENFIIRDDKSVQGWSFYGGWYGMPYEEWCAMFVSYCLEKAGIGKGIMPHSANCNRWKGYLGKRYIDDEDDYIPAAGDLIFFHHDRVSKDPNFPNHIGIVSGYDAEKGIVYTIEGNSGKSVRTHQYSHSDSVIVGYASMRYCMVRWDRVYRARLSERMASNRINSNKTRKQVAETVVE